MKSKIAAAGGGGGDDAEFRFLTVEEVSKLLKIRKLGVYALIKSGKLRAARFGRRLRISDADFKAYVRNAFPPPEDDFPFPDPLSLVDA